MVYYNSPRCGTCGSRLDKEQHALLLGKSPYEKECPTCGAELCPKCGHRRSAHRISLYCGDVVHFFHPCREDDYLIYRDNPLQEKCCIATSETSDCDCTYYSCNIDEEMNWNIIPLDSGTMEA